MQVAVVADWEAVAEAQAVREAAVQMEMVQLARQVRAAQEPAAEREEVRVLPVAFPAVAAVVRGEQEVAARVEMVLGTPAPERAGKSMSPGPMPRCMLRRLALLV